MAGHSQFKNIMHRKGAQDAKRAKIFTKVIREITVAVKEGGADVESNPRLRLALSSARSVNMPKDNIDRAIKKALGDGGDVTYESIRYEGYGPGGVALIVEALTDNRNRTAADVRSCFNKYGGNLGEPNSVSFQFDRCGLLTFKASGLDEEALFEKAVEAGAEDMSSYEGVHVVTVPLENFHKVRDALAATFGEPDDTQIQWIPQNLIPLDNDAAQGLQKLIDALEDNDDVQTVTGNHEVDGTL